MFKIQSLILGFSMIFASCASQKKMSPEERKANILYNYGTQDLAKQNYKSALDKLRRAYRFDSTNSDIANNLGMAYYLRGDRKSGENYINKSLELDPNNSNARMNLASIYLENDRLDEAEKIYQIILKDLVYPHQHRTYYNLAIIAEKRGNIKQAKNYFKQSLIENEGHCAASLKLSLLQRKEKLIYESLETIKKGSLGTCYKNPNVAYELGEAFYLVGDIEKALYYFKDIQDRFHGTNFYSKATKRISYINKEMGIDGDPRSLYLNQQNIHNKKNNDTYKQSNRVKVIQSPKF